VRRDVRARPGVPLLPRGGRPLLRESTQRLRRHRGRRQGEAGLQEKGGARQRTASRAVPAEARLAPLLQLPARPHAHDGGPGGAQGGANVPQFGPDSRVSYENSVSNYDYYGALPAKTSNYIARTANFSAFGK